MAEAEAYRDAQQWVARAGAEDDDVENLLADESFYFPKKNEEECVEQNLRDESVLEWWKKTSGLHTVQKWCENYTKHPAAWGALLMIHGIPEVSGRMRSKVETFAMYSALFLSASIPAIMTPPAAITCSTFYERPGENAVGDSDWECAIRKRVFFYCIMASIGLHLLCILVAMSFCNALNETAREADVLRMFARGQGFMATWKCETAFRCGVIVDLLAIFAVAEYYLGPEIMVFSALFFYGLYVIYDNTSNLLFSSGSLVNYWRKELGGNPDADDPFDLSVPLARFKARAKLARQGEFARVFGAYAADGSEPSRPQSARPPSTARPTRDTPASGKAPRHAPVPLDLAAVEGVGTPGMDSRSFERNGTTDSTSPVAEPLEHELASPTTQGRRLAAHDAVDNNRPRSARSGAGVAWGVPSHGRPGPLG